MIFSKKEKNQLLKFIFSITFFSFFLQSAFLSAEAEEKIVKAENLATIINSEIMSPYCPGRTLSACPSPKAIELRNEVLSKAKNGSSEAEIMTWLESVYGSKIFSSPRSGFNYYLAWFVPFLFLLLGFALVFIKLYSSKTKSESLDDTKELELDSKSTAKSKSIEEKFENIVKERFS